jgi:hypothetical protein
MEIRVSIDCGGRNEVSIDWHFIVCRFNLDENGDDTTLPPGAPECLIAPLSPELRTVLEEDATMWQTIIDFDPRFVLDPVDERGGTFGRHYKNRSSKDEENELVVEASSSTVEDS